MTTRKPRILSAVRSTDNFAHPTIVPGHVDVHIVYDGLQTQPVDTLRMAAAEALALAEQLIRAARQSLDGEALS